MSVPRYLIEKKAKEFDESLEIAHARYPHRGYGDDAYDLPALNFMASKYRKVVRDLRQDSRRKSNSK